MNLIALKLVLTDINKHLKVWYYQVSYLYVSLKSETDNEFGKTN